MKEKNLQIKKSVRVPEKGFLKTNVKMFFPPIFNLLENCQVAINSEITPLENLSHFGARPIKIT